MASNVPGSDAALIVGNSVFFVCAGTDIDREEALRRGESHREEEDINMMSIVGLEIPTIQVWPLSKL